MNITYLGPAGATFSAIAYDRLAVLFGAPLSTDPDVTLGLAKSNEQILPLLLKHGGYGAIAMETMAEGRVDPPINSFIELIRKCNGQCPLRVIGALRMRIKFALLARPGISIGDIKKIYAHPKAIGACRGKISSLGAEIIESESNGQAASDVSVRDILEKAAALGPMQAAEKYGLNVLADSFEDKEAVTTFFLLGPRDCRPESSQIYRSLIVFRIKHMPGALVKVLQPFADQGINLRLVHSLYFENGVYDFAIETESGPEDLAKHERAALLANSYMDKHIQFGPFPVVSG
jgi:prephenate dehydratase